MLERIRRRLADFTIRRKMILMCVGIIAVMTGLTGLTGFLFVRGEITAQEESAAAQIVPQIGENIDSSLNNISGFVFQQYFNSDLAMLIGRQERTAMERLTLGRLMSATAQNLMNYERDICMVAICDTRSVLYFEADESMKAEEERMAASIPYEQAMNGWGKICLSGYDSACFLISRAIVDKTSMMRTGVLTIAVRTQFLTDIYRDSIRKGSEILLANADGEALLPMDPQQSTMAAAIAGYEKNGDEGGQKLYYREHPYRYVSWHSPKHNLWMINLIDTALISAQAGRILMPFLYIGLLALVLSVGIAWLITAQINDRMTVLLMGIRQVSEGDLQVRTQLAGKDELGMISTAFDDLSGRLQGMVEELSEEKSRQKSAQIKALEFEYSALQAKINPHFLYNTLEGINSMAKLHGEEDISACIQLLGDYLRDTINVKRRFVTAREEMENIRAYMRIQTITSGERISFVTGLDESLEDALMPKLILQPLVENAFIHGVSAQEGKGCIRVDIRLRGEQMEVLVEDDGLGMSPEQLAQALSEEEMDTAGKVGVISVHKRLQILYGPEYGLHIESTQGAGTRIRFRLPVYFEGEMEDETV